MAESRADRLATASTTPISAYLLDRRLRAPARACADAPQQKGRECRHHLGEQIRTPVVEPLDHHLVQRPEPRERGYPRVERRNRALRDGLVEMRLDQRREALAHLHALGEVSRAETHRLEEEDAR